MGGPIRARYKTRYPSFVEMDIYLNRIESNRIGEIMVNWKYAEQNQLRILRTLRLMFFKHPYLLEFLFERDKPELRQQSEILIKEAGVFSSGERILIQIGLDLWSDSGNARLWDILERLDDLNYKYFLLGLLNARDVNTHVECEPF